MSHNSEFRSKGNFMTWVYYTARLFSVYAKEINDTRVLYDRRGIKENNNLDHGTRPKNNVVKRLNKVSLCWNVDSFSIFWFESIRDLKYFKTASWTSKLEEWKTITQLKEILLHEWDISWRNSISTPSLASQLVWSLWVRTNYRLRPRMTHFDSACPKYVYV